MPPSIAHPTSNVVEDSIAVSYASVMKYFGFLSFGHYTNGGHHGISAAQSLRQAIDLAVAADEIGVNGAFFRVHHFAPQAAAPMPLLSAIASRTKAIEVGTGVIDIR